MTGFRAWRNVRVRLLAILLVVLSVTLALSTYGLNVLFMHSTSRSANSTLHARASSELALIALRHGRLASTETAKDALADSQVWIYDHAGVVEAPSRRSPLDTNAARLSRGRSRTLNVPGTDIRLYSAPIVINGKRQGTLVTGISLAPYEDAEHRALFGSFALAAIMLTLTGILTWWLLKAALRPVAQMTEQAAAWSDLELDRRFDRGAPHDELTLLAGTLDGMLDRIATSLRRERRFSAELSHELRTPLARVIGEVELALAEEQTSEEYHQTLRVVLRNAEQLTRIVETLVAASQQDVVGARGTADAFEIAAEAVGGVSHLAADRRVRIQAQKPATPLRLGLDGDLAERVLHPVVENACRYGSSWARVSVSRAGSKIVYVVEDDGPGVADQESESIFEPGKRGLAAGRSESPGAGLGLALARRLARAVAGDVTARARPEGGCFVVTLPSA